MLFIYIGLFYPLDFLVLYEGKLDTNLDVSGGKSSDSYTGMGFASPAYLLMFLKTLTLDLHHS